VPWFVPRTKRQRSVVVRSSVPPRPFTFPLSATALEVRHWTTPLTRERDTGVATGAFVIDQLTVARGGFGDGGFVDSDAHTRDGRRSWSTGPTVRWSNSVRNGVNSHDGRMTTT
jgi:hypothetical protein